MVFQFEHSELDQQPGKQKWDLLPLNVGKLKAVLAKWQTELGNEGWNSLFWNNHDLPRIVSRWGNDKEYRVESAKMFAILLHMMKGTPYIYQGEEIGMTNKPITDISEVEDIESRNMYHERLEAGYKKADIIKSINTKGRDNARTPIQWDESENGGFTTGTPWLAVNPNYKQINVKDALADKNSVFYTYQKLVQLRRDNPIMIWGDFKLLDTPDTIFAYERSYQGQTWLIVNNFSNDKQTVSFDEKIGETIIQNYDHAIKDVSKLELSPWESFVVKVED